MPIANVTAGQLIDPTTFGNAVIDAVNALLPTSTVPRVFVRPLGTQVATSGVNTVVTWAGTEDVDTNGFHSTTADTSRLTVPAGLGGVYSVSYSCLIAGGTGIFSGWITKNGGATRYGFTQVANEATNGASVAMTDHITLAAGDYVELNVFHNAGSNRTIGNASLSTFSMYRVGP